MKKRGKNSWFSIAVKIAVSALIIFFLFRIADFKALSESIKGMNIWLFLLSAALIYPGMLLRAIRFKLIINKEGFSISTNDSFKLALIGSALNIFMPASTGDFAKAYYGYKRHRIKEEMISASIVDKIIALLSLFIISGISSLIFRMTSFFLISLFCLLMCSAVVFFPRILPWKILNKFLAALKRNKLDEKKLVKTFTLDSGLKLRTILLSIAGWIVTYSQLYLICIAYSADVSFFYLLAVSSLFMLARLFPLTLNGIGSTEAMVAYLFGLIGIGFEAAVAISLTNTIVSLIIPGIAGFFVILAEK
ncbi:MAG: lysylphosphatidylglycerol synthase transmembrane domain-containing protein [Candidatus Woesearchaeota archaeon]|nr:lysylphosphatidylglycerol synthase transmembrane domain-containing protein [Candidatus Woesearchaeota archaeon]